MDEKTFKDLPEEQRVAAQKRLIDLGLYNASPDGKWGAGTKAAFELEAKQKDDAAKAARDAEASTRADKLEEQKIANRTLELQTAGKTSDADNALKTAAALRKA